MIDFTTVVGVDAQHIGELRFTFPTWARHRPEILRQPLLILADASIATRPELFEFIFALHRRARVVPVPDAPGESQRAKMLTAFVTLAPYALTTPWMLKLDTDAPALRPDPRWCEQHLVAPDADGRECAFTASPWGYTKPGSWIATLNGWAQTQPDLRDRPALPGDPRADRVATPGRIISYVFWGRTDWLISAAERGAPPVPSQDTYHWYLAQRRGDFFRRFKMKAFGWDHVRARHLAAVCSRALA